MKSSISRRGFLRGVLGSAGLTIAASVTPFGYKLLSAKEVGKAAFAPSVWLEITSNNLVTVTIPSSEMGQGTWTALSMIVADELEADWSQIRIKQAPGDKAFVNPLGSIRDQLTVGSSTIRGYYDILRKAGAAGRTMLVKAAADTWKVPEAECQASNGVVLHKKSKKKLVYGKLCDKAGGVPIPQEPVLKKDGEFRFMGRPMARLDIPDKVQGSALFGLDFRIPDMLVAVLARPPYYGAKPVTFNQAAAEKTAGVRKVIPIPMGVAVCADTVDAALKGRDALKPTWDKGSNPDLDNESIEKVFLEQLGKTGAVAKNEGDARQALAGAAKKVDATYFVNYIAHTTMEPINCTAHVTKDACTVWAPTQGPLVAKLVASHVCGLPMEKINVYVSLLGGGFGRRATPDFVAESVLISKLSGKPIKVVWTREDDIKYDQYRAATAQRIEGGLDGDGKLIAWSHKVVCGSLLKDIAPQAIMNGVDAMSLWGLIDFPNSPDNNNITYGIPNFHLEYLMNELPIPVSPWRSVQNGPNAFVIEAFVDELAHAAGKDPVEFRLQHLKDNPRAKRVVEVVAEKAGWGKPVPGGHGRGIAQHSCFGSYVAQVADISLDKSSGVIKVHKVVVAVDCGPAVNPHTIEAQIQGSVIMSLSAALKEKVQFANGGVKSANFNDYKIFKMSDVPVIEVHIIKSTDKIGGIGEPGVPPAAPAVANAFFNLTGIRVRELPLDPRTVLEAIKNKGMK
jgi:isoquinoline 1-oxidoreductase subunit beta